MRKLCLVIRMLNPVLWNWCIFVSNKKRIFSPIVEGMLCHGLVTWIPNGTRIASAMEILEANGGEGGH